jgi:outer membrane protein assembly factor BamB
MNNEMKKVALTLVCLIILASAALQPFVSADWSMFRSNSFHDGVGTTSSSSGNVDRPTQLWQSNLKWEIPVNGFLYRERTLTEPAVVNGVIYVGAKSSVTINKYQGAGSLDMYALNATNGAIIWDFKDTSSSDLTPPAVANDMVYFATNNYICALNARDGSLFWNFSTFTVFSYPIVFQDMLLIGGREGNNAALLALNATNGHIIWSFKNVVNGNTFHTPTISNGRVFVTSFDGNMYALNLLTGQKIWSSQKGFSGCPTVEENIVYGITGDANVYALDCATGVKRWNYSMNDGYATDQEPYFAIFEKVLYARNGWNKIYAFNAQSGSNIWRMTLFQDGFAVGVSEPTVVVNNTLYFGSEKGLYALNSLNGEIVWKFNTSLGFGAPVVVNGVLYVTSNEQVNALQIPSLAFETNSETLLVGNASIVLVVLSVTVIVSASLLLFRRHRKTANLKNKRGMRMTSPLSDGTNPTSCEG